MNVHCYWMWWNVIWRSAAMGWDGNMFCYGIPWHGMRWKSNEMQQDGNLFCHGTPGNVMEIRRHGMRWKSVLLSKSMKWDESWLPWNEMKVHCHGMRCKSVALCNPWNEVEIRCYGMRWRSRRSKMKLRWSSWLSEPLALQPLARAVSQGVTSTLSTAVHIRQINRETNKQLATNNLYSSSNAQVHNTNTQKSVQQTENHWNSKTLDYVHYLEI